MKWRVRDWKSTPVEDLQVELFEDWEVALFGPGGEQVSNWTPVTHDEPTIEMLASEHSRVASHVGCWRDGAFVGFWKLESMSSFGNCDSVFMLHIPKRFGWIPGLGVVSERSRYVP
jgi:RimJ/RimL family protein N-acetyltransferase